MIFKILKILLKYKNKKYNKLLVLIENINKLLPPSDSSIFAGETAVSEVKHLLI